MSRNVRDDVDRFFEYGIDLSTKTLYMGSEVYDENGNEAGVDHSMASKVIKGLHILDNTKKELPLTIIMNNPGGDVLHGMAIYDAIKACSSQIVIKAFGQAMSMGSIILQAADQRILSPNSKFMIHYGYDGHSSNHPKIIEKWVEEGKKSSKDMEQLYLEKIREKHPDFKLQRLQKMLDFDTILNAEEAVDLGLADAILGEES